MSDRDALLSAILAQPAEDVPRLIYADWLQENGQPERAEFIRAQVWAAQAEPFSPQARAHADAAKKLERAHSAGWAQHIRQRVTQWQFVRGFIEHVGVNAERFPPNAGPLFAAEPVRSLQVFWRARLVDDEPGPFAAFFNAPQLERVVRLSLSNLGLAAPDFDALAACPHLGNLTHLSLRNNPVNPGWLTTLLVGPALPALTGLDLGSVTNLGPALADALPRVEHRRFTRLDLGHIAFTWQQIKPVLESRCVQGVEELRLEWLTGSGRPGPLTHLNLGWVLPLERLRLLDLTGQGVGNAGVAELVGELKKRPDAPLRWLGLANNGIGPDGIRALLDSSLNLFYLDLRDNEYLDVSEQAALERRFPNAVLRLEAPE
jgi:uncharacterized protein (TIGR02996 family)